MRLICKVPKNKTNAKTNPPINQDGVNKNPEGGIAVTVGVTLGVAVGLGPGVSLGGGVTRAPDISAFSVPNRSRPGVRLGPGVGDGGRVEVSELAGTRVSPGRRLELGLGLILRGVAVGLGLAVSAGG